MTAILKLVRLDDFAADVDSIDLLSGGFSLAANGYAPAVAPINAKSVHETITLTLQGTSTDDLALMVQEIDRKIKQVQWWIEDSNVERYQVWLRVQMDEESNPRQAQLVNIEPSQKVNEFTTQETADHTIVEYQIGIERTPFWEQPYPYPSTTQLSNVNVIGGVATLAEVIHGDVPARLLRLGAFKNDASAGLSNFWYGWKTSRFGTKVNFVPVWSLALGSGRDTDTTVVADATAYNGDKITCTFATVTTLLQRTVITVANVTANYNDQRGTYDVLLRAKMSDTSVARVRIGYSLSSGTTLLGPVYRNRVPISGTAWKIYEMGTISIPPQRIYNSQSVKFFGINISAELYSGTGDIDMDCFILIPRDDGSMAVVSSVSVESGQVASVFQAADGSVFGYADNGTGDSMGPVTLKPGASWGVPANDESPNLIFVASDATFGSTKSKTEHIIYTAIPRYRTLRGAGIGPTT